jgi:hypothetical protein
MSYSSSKVLATLGQGSIIVKDKDNSDDINSLNRDANSQINKLYEGSVGTSVEASIDHRLLSEEGRKSIKEDIETTSNFISILANTISKESMSLFVSNSDEGVTNLFDNIKLEEAQKQATLDFILTHPKEAAILANKDSTDEQRQEAYGLLQEAVNYQLGISTIDTLNIVYDTSKPNQSGSTIKGHTSETGDIYIVKNRQDNAYDEVSTAFNEFSDYYDVYNHVGADRQDDTYKLNRSEYSEYFGNTGADWLDFRYVSSGQNSLNGFSYTDANTPTVNSILNAITYNSLDKTIGASRQSTVQEKARIHELSPDFAKQYGISNEDAKKVLTVAVMSNINEKDKKKYDNFPTNQEIEEQVNAILNEYTAGTIDQHEAKIRLSQLEGSLTSAKPEDALVWIPPLIPQYLTQEIVNKGYEYLVENTEGETIYNHYNVLIPEVGYVQDIFTATSEQFANNYWNPDVYLSTDLPLQDDSLTFLFGAKWFLNLGKGVIDDVARVGGVGEGAVVRNSGNIIPEGKLANHIFSGKSGKLADTTANRNLITDLTNNNKNFLGIDKYGKSWYARTLDDGTQLYGYTQNGIVKGAGINSKPLEIPKLQGLK